MKLWIVEYEDGEGGKQWEPIAAAEESSARIRFALEMKKLYGEDIRVDIVKLQAIEEAQGHKITVE